MYPAPSPRKGNGNMNNRELDAKIAELMGWELGDISTNPNGGLPVWKTGKGKDFIVKEFLPWEPSTDIAAAMQVDKEDWLWSFFETPTQLQVTLYTSLEIWGRRPFDMQLITDEIITIDVNWNECATKAEVYALGRCLAALKAVEDK